MMILRWLLAVAAAAVSFLVVFGAFRLAWAYSGSSAAYAYTMAIGWSSVTAVFVGTMMAPGPRWERNAATITAILVLIFVAVAVGSMLTGTYRRTHLMDILLAIGGSFGAFGFLRVYHNTKSQPPGR